MVHAFEPFASTTRPWVEGGVGGQGPPLLALPPAQGDWRNLLPAFAPLAASHRVVLLSLRGERGHAAAPGSTYADLVEDVEEAFRTLGLESAVLAGTSFGGTVALAFALARPERVSALVLNVTTARLRDHARVVKLASRRRAEALAPPFHLYALALCAPELLALPPRRLVAALRRFRRIARERATPASTLMRRIDLLTRFDVEEELPRIRCPTLVLSGERGLDLLVPQRSQRALVERIPGARHEVVAGTGHLGILTSPERVAAAVSHFLGAPTSGGG